MLPFMHQIVPQQPLLFSDPTSTPLPPLFIPVQSGWSCVPGKASPHSIGEGGWAGKQKPAMSYFPHHGWF